MKFEVCGSSIIGGRDYQEDSWAASNREGGGIYSGTGSAVETFDTSFFGLVADGIGGGGNGDVASQLVAQRLPELYFQEPGKRVDLADCITQIDSELGRLKADNPNYGRSMGTTLVAAYFDPQFMEFASVGDSIIYRFRHDEVHILNEAHEYGYDLDLQALKLNGDLDHAQRQSNRSSITSAILGTGVQKIQTAKRELCAGDTLILASDGIELVPPELMRQIVFAFQNQPIASLANVINKLVEAKGQNFQGGGHDNCTTLIVRCLEGSTEEVLEQPQNQFSQTGSSASSQTSSIEDQPNQLSDGFTILGHAKKNIIVICFLVVLALLVVTGLFVSGAISLSKSSGPHPFDEQKDQNRKLFPPRSDNETPHDYPRYVPIHPPFRD